MARTNTQRGITLIDTIVGIALLLTVFVGLSGVFQLTVTVVTNNKARIGALSLANERVEYIRSLSYQNVGTSGGIPSGVIPQSELVELNGVGYTRTTLVRYVDAPEDGLDVDDENGVTADYKEVKVSVSWQLRGDVRSLSIVTRVSPPGVESDVPGGTLRIAVVDAVGDPIPQALVSIYNASVTPPVDVDVLSNDNGYAIFVGAPEGAGYEVVVTKDGFSTAQTYAATAENPNPDPGHRTVVENTTTASTFAIDTLANMSVRTFNQISEAQWEDTFAADSNLATSTNIEVVGGVAQLVAPSLSGLAQSLFSSPVYLAGWKSVEWDDTVPADTTIVYQVYFAGLGFELVPDEALPGNSTGFTSSPVDISGLSTTTYPSLSLGATFTTTDPDVTPELDSWRIIYDEGPVPLPNLTFTLRGNKTIGEDAGDLPIYKFLQAYDSGASAIVSDLALEWDTYTISVDGSGEGYDVAESCSSQPQAVAPGETVHTRLYFAPHTPHSLLVKVRASGAELEGALVSLTRGAFEVAETSSSCGQVFFPGLSEGTVAGDDAYTIIVSAPGFEVFTSDVVDVSGSSQLSVILNPS